METTSQTMSQEVWAVHKLTEIMDKLDNLTERMNKVDKLQLKKSETLYIDRSHLNRLSTRHRHHCPIQTCPCQYVDKGVIMYQTVLNFKTHPQNSDNTGQVNSVVAMPV